MDTISSLKAQLAALFPDQNKREQAERRLQSATSRSVNRNTARQKSASRRQKLNSRLCNLKAKLDELTTLMNVFSKRENRTRVPIYLDVFSTDSARATRVRLISKSIKRQLKRKAHKIQYKPNNDRLSNIVLTDNRALLSKGLKYIPTPPKPASNKSLIRDLSQFNRIVRLKYIFANSKSKPYPFHVKSSWQPPPRPSGVLESYLKHTKHGIASVVFSDTKDNLTAKQR